MEDYGQVLKIEGIDLPSVYQVDFSNSLLRGTSKTVLGNADGVAIPDEYISTGRDVYAFLYITGDMWGRTIATVRIPNKTRPKRTDEIPTPTQQSIIDQTIAALNDAVESTAADAEQTASDAARAEAARTAAETAEDNAEASATAAAQSEANAAQSESTASAAVTSASASAASAATNADRAEQAAAQSGYLWFYIENGKLYMDRTQNTHVNFFMRDGKLYVEEVS
jgi:regulator of protease activity HflC (stomatin/prohibitin superfamily)